MNLPLYMKDIFGYEAGLAWVVIVGFLFGFVLERAGFGRAQNIVAQFYFDDMRVLKVMFTAVATAAVGVGGLASVGVLDVGAITVPASFLWPEIVGGLMVGVGMVVSGYCPGTSVVASASGNFDGLAALGGILVGSLLFGIAFPAIEGFYLSTPLDQVMFPEILGVPRVVLAAGVVLMAVGVFLAGERLERLMAERNQTEPPPASPAVRNRVLGALAVLAALGLVTLPMEGRTPSTPPPKAVSAISALELARALVQDASAYHLVDLRDRASCLAQTIPGAVCVPEGEQAGAFMVNLPSTRTLALFDQGDLIALPAAARAFGGPMITLTGGFDAFRRRVLTRPEPPPQPTRDNLAQYRLRSALHGEFTGARVALEPVEIQPMKVTRTLKKGGGC